MVLTCSSCRLEKDSDRFSKKNNSKRGYSYKCKDCQNEYVRDVWYIKNVEKQRLSSAKWKVENPVRNLAHRYKTTEEIMQGHIDRADGKCEACGEVPYKALNVDHCHSTGNIRGMLCGNCNRALGLLKDSPETLLGLLSYIRR